MEAAPGEVARAGVEPATFRFYGPAFRRFPMGADNLL